MFSEPQTPEVYNQAELFYCDLGTPLCSEFYKVSEIKTKCVLNKPTSLFKKSSETGTYLQVNIPPRTLNTCAQGFVTVSFNSSYQILS